MTLLLWRNRTEFIEIRQPFDGNLVWEYHLSIVLGVGKRIEWRSMLRLGGERCAGHFFKCGLLWSILASLKILSEVKIDGSRSVFIPTEQRATASLTLLPELKSWTYHRLNDSKLNFLISNSATDSECNQSLWERSSHSFNLVNLWTIIKKIARFCTTTCLGACTMAIFDAYSLILQHSLNRRFIIKMRWNCAG